MTSLASRVPISARLAVAIAASFLALLLVVGIIVYHQLGAGLRSALDRQLTDAAATMLDDLELDDDEEPGSLGTEFLDDVESPSAAVQLLDANGRVVAAVGDATGLPPLLSPADLATVRSATPGLRTIPAPAGAGGSLRVLSVPLDGGDAVALVVGQLQPVEQAQRALLAVYGPVAVLASVMAGVLGYLIARRGLAPIGRMTAEANAIGTGDLARRLPQPDRLDEVGRLAMTLNGMLARLHSAIEREREFAADASHELRTPLAILRAEIELARKRVADQSTRASLDSALEEADRLAGLTDDLLVLARADDNRPIERSALDLGELAATVVARFDTLAARREVTLRATGVAVVSGDARSLERAVANLVDNAIRHTPAGGAVTVEVTPEAHGSARLVVSDTGPGLATDQLERAFERFTRIDGARQRPGRAGLGLAIVAAVAAAHSGEVSAANSPDGGLRTTLTLR